MPHLWVEVGAEWGLLPIGTDHLTLTGDPNKPIVAGSSAALGDDNVFLVPVTPSESVLISRPGASRVNGDPVDLGIRTLMDKDEIQAGHSARLFYSSENPARIAPFSEKSAETICARCLMPIADGQSAVVCPACSTAVHEDIANDLLCWSYGTCPVCRRPGTLEDDYQWTPESL